MKGIVQQTRWVVSERLSIRRSLSTWLTARHISTSCLSGPVLNSWSCLLLPPPTSFPSRIPLLYDRHCRLPSNLSIFLNSSLLPTSNQYDIHKYSLESLPFPSPLLLQIRLTVTPFNCTKSLDQSPDWLFLASRIALPPVYSSPTCLVELLKIKIW